jgi:UDP-N-acetyl-D-glucosamine dehydrogenase
MKTALIEKLNQKSAVIGIIGLGYVGLPLMMRFVASGYRVVGIDIDPVKVAMLNEGRSYIGHFKDQAIRQARDRGFSATTDFESISGVDGLILSVPTPLDRYREPDLTFVINTVESAVPYLRRGQLLSLESTTYPGTTEEELLPRIERAGLKVGTDFFLIYSPEREDPGNPDFNTRTIPKICSGYTADCRAVGETLYRNIVDQVVSVSSLKVAEMTKLLENIHRSVNIGLVNELKMVTDKMGIDIYEVIQAAATKPFGFTPYYPGPGLGGHCIPIDPFYLTWKAREYGVTTRFIELAGEVNNGMPRWVIDKCIDALNERGRAVKGSRVLVLGIAYKKNVDDMRESPSVELMEMLRDKGALIDYADPHIPVFPRMREHHFDLTGIELTPERVAAYDLVLLATDHSAFDYEMIQQNAQVIVDTRGVYQNPTPNVVKA